MKEDAPTTLATAINVERMERIIQRDREELELERRIDNLAGLVRGKNRRGMLLEEVKKISKKFYDIANGMVEDQQYSESVELYSKSISILKTFMKRKAVDSYFNRAITLAMLGYPNMAMDDLNAIEKKKPPKPDVFFVKGQIYESLGKRKMAIRMYEKCLGINPQFYRAQNSLRQIREES